MRRKMRKGKRKGVISYGVSGNTRYGEYTADEPASPLTPHTPETKVERMGDSPIPSILLSIEAYRDIQYIMDESGREEIGWLGSVRETEDNKYLIEKVFLFKQTVSFGHCELDQNNVSQFYVDMLKENPANKPLLNSILFWGHVHPGDWVGPSRQDEDTMELFAHNKFFIRGIFSRSGHCSFTFFDYERKLKIVDCPWSVYIADDDARKKKIAKEIKEKVSNSYVGGGYISPWPETRGKDWWKGLTFGDS
jgi:hypothetical protein